MTMKACLKGERGGEGGYRHCNVSIPWVINKSEQHVRVLDDSSQVQRRGAVIGRARDGGTVLVDEILHEVNRPGGLGAERGLRQ